MKYRKRPPPAHPNLDFRWGTGRGSLVSNKFYRIYIEISHLGHNVIKKAFK